MSRQAEQFREQSVLSALRVNSGLSTVADINTTLRRRAVLFGSRVITGEQIIDTLNSLTPQSVRLSDVHNRRGSAMYAPADREASAREKRVGSDNLFVRTLNRWWYVDIRGIRTCDL